MAFEQAIQPGDWFSGRQFDADGHAIAFDPTHLNTINGVTQQAKYGPYFQSLLDSGVISKDRMMSGSDQFGGQGQQWFPGNDGNIYLVDGSGQRPVTRIPMSNIDPRTGKDKVGSVSDFLDPNTGALTGTGKADFAKIDPGEMIALATIAAISGGAALTGLGAIGGAAAGGGVGGGGAVGGAGGFIGEGAASGIGAWDGALAAAPSWGGAAAAGGTAAMGAGADGLGGGLAADGTMDLGGGITMGADGAISGGTPFATSGLSNSAILESVGASGLAPAQIVSNPSLLQQIATKLGLPASSLSQALSTGSSLSSLIGPAVSAIGGAMSANAAKDAANSAANSQMQAAQLGIDEWKRQFDTVRGLLNPYVQAGTQAVGAQGDLAGINGADKQQAAISNLQTMPAYTSQLKLGENRILQNAAATGGLRGGNTEGALAYFAPQLLASTINDQYTRLGGLTSIGANAAAGVGNAGMTTTQGVTGLIQQGGAAQAGAAIAGGAAQQRLYGGLSTALGQYFGYGGGVPGMTGTTAAPAASGVPANPFL